MVLIFISILNCVSFLCIIKFFVCIKFAELFFTESLCISMYYTLRKKNITRVVNNQFHNRVTKYAAVYSSYTFEMDECKKKKKLISRKPDDSHKTVLTPLYLRRGQVFGRNEGFFSPNPIVVLVRVELSPALSPSVFTLFYASTHEF